MPDTQAADPIADALRRMPLTNSQRADAWDAFHASADPAAFTATLQQMPIPQQAKAQLWDLKQQTTKPPDITSTNAKDDQGNAIVDPNTIGTFASHAVTAANPVALGQMLPLPKALGGSGMDHPLAVDGSQQYAPNFLKQMHAVKREGDARWESGDHVGAIAKYVESVIPIIGPMMSHEGNQLEGGKDAAALGDLVGLLAPFGVAKALKSANISVPRVLPTNPNAAEAAAVRFGESRGIPVDAGTTTGSQFVKNVQKKAGSTWGGANTAETAKTAQQAALTNTGDALAGEVNASRGTPGPVVDPLRAGGRVTSALESKIQGFDQAATAAYDRLRQFEADPARAARMQVDLRAAKTQLRPMYDALMREKDLAPLMGGKARALVALDKLMTGPDAAPLTVVDAALGDLKAMARGAEMPELRTQGQGVAAGAVKQLDASVRATATHAGPDVWKALQDGRTATTAKYDVAGVREQFSVNEPRKVFNELTAKKDVAIERLNAVAKHAPEQLPHIGRAVLEDMLDTATSEGGFGHTDKLWADWQKLGPQTKRMLFGQQTEDINHFFLLAKKLGENPNPSGTAQVLSATQLLVGVPGWAVAKILYSPKAVRALTRSLSYSLGNTRLPATVQAAAYADVVKAAREAGVDLSALPKAADQPEATR